MNCEGLHGERRGEKKDENKNYHNKDEQQQERDANSELVSSSGCWLGHIFMPYPLNQILVFNDYTSTMMWSH